LKGFLPFFHRGRRIGWLRPGFAEKLEAWPGTFARVKNEVHLQKTDQLHLVMQALQQQGLIPGWRDERYRIEDLFEIERAAARPFGLTTYAVHVNGLSQDRMWIARRSAAKPIDPGMLDNLVGGGMTAGLTQEQVLVKEAWEEAGIPAELARKATRGGMVRILREVPEGVQSEVIYVYDLVLPPDFQPTNQDGEVSEFMLLPLEEVFSLKNLTYDATLVARDYQSRNRTPRA
jgi:8-oxo-dGTP pyrophosphatase MutT (NUDIX family)